MGRVGTHHNVVDTGDGRLKCEDCGFVAEGHGEMEDQPC